VEGRQISSARFAMAITHGCDGLELSLLLAAGLLAYPASVVRKLLGLLGGLGAIALMSFIRVVTLWVVGVHWRAAFDFIHFNLWPAVLIGCTLAFFILRVRRAIRPAVAVEREDGRGDAPALSG